MPGAGAPPAKALPQDLSPKPPQLRLVAGLSWRQPPDQTIPGYLMGIKAPGVWRREPRGAPGAAGTCAPAAPATSLRPSAAPVPGGIPGGIPGCPAGQDEALPSLWDAAHPLLRFPVKAGPCFSFSLPQQECKSGKELLENPR